MSDAETLPPPVLPPPTPEGMSPPPIGILHGSDRSYSVDIIVCAAITSLIGTIFVALRFYTRRVLLRVLGWEDWLILLAQVFSIACAVSYMQQAALGLGKHWWLVDPPNIVPMARAGWYSILFYEMSLWFAQVSILILYLRIWTYPWVRRCTWALMFIIMAYNIFVFISIFIACIPLRSYWDFVTPPKYCHSKDVWFANTYLHIITDFMIYFLPMPVILQLRFPRRQKILLFVLFAFGFFVCMISIIRLVYLLATANTTDVPYDNTVITYWTSVETNATVVVACFMTMKPLLSKWFPNLINPSQESASDPQQHTPGDADASPDANGRVPTIGSKPTRAVLAGHHHRRSWHFFGRGGTGIDPDENDEKDLEAAADNRSDVDSPKEKTPISELKSFPSSGTTLDESASRSRTTSASN